MDNMSTKSWKAGCAVAPRKEGGEARFRVLSLALNALRSSGPHWQKDDWNNAVKCKIRVCDWGVVRHGVYRHGCRPASEQETSPSTPSQQATLPSAYGDNLDQAAWPCDAASVSTARAPEEEKPNEDTISASASSALPGVLPPVVFRLFLAKRIVRLPGLPDICYMSILEVVHSEMFIEQSGRVGSPIQDSQATA